MKRKTIVLGLLLLSCSCTTTYRIERYDLNKKYVTGVGSPMVVREIGHSIKAYLILTG